MKWVQYTLFKQLGYGDDSDVVDGVFGSATELAVTTFQSNYGLDVDGVVGPQTIGKIVEVILERLNPDPPPSHKWYDDYSPVDLGSFYGKISNQSNGLYFTDIGSTIEGTSATDGAGQIWKFEHQADGSYKIINHANGYPMDVSGAGTVDGTDVRTWADDNGSSAQRFFIYNMFGSYYIRPLCSDLPLDMSLGTDDNNVATWGYGAEWPPQMFDIEKIDVNGFLPVNIGNNFIARIKNQSNNLYFTDTGSTIAGMPAFDQNSQVWKFEYQSNGSYKIINQSNGYPMDIYNANTDDGTDVRTWSDDNASKAQRFYIYRAYDSYYIKPLCSDKVLDMSLETDDHNVATWGFGADWDPQKFDIDKVNISVSELSISRDCVFIGEEVKFTANSDYAAGYTISIDKDDERLITQEMPNGELTLRFDEPGAYSAYVTSYNSEDYVDSEPLSFTITDKLSLLTGTKKSLFYGKGYTYKSSNEDVGVVSTSGVITAIAKGMASITVIDEDMNTFKIRLTVSDQVVPGDCNNDGIVSVLDVVTLQKWILAASDARLSSTEAADMNSDDVIDVFDLGLLKRVLVQK